MAHAPVLSSQTIKSGKTVVSSDSPPREDDKISLQSTFLRMNELENRRMRKPMPNQIQAFAEDNIWWAFLEQVDPISFEQLSQPARLMLKSRIRLQEEGGSLSTRNERTDRANLRP
tara:strand:+ start:1650 stop:1997 length:348 start_codon:yes stop_codon:yes gene_type:complete